jgi:5-(aminomethyl)-3-furanmethanol phosphate kinase
MIGPCRVIKLGGSLLDYDRMVPQLRAWLAAQPPLPGLMLVGGGELADAIRRAFTTHALGEEAAHWLCIRLLGVTAELVARLLPEAALAKHLDELPAEDGTRRLVILEPERILRDDEPRPRRTHPGETEFSMGGPDVPEGLSADKRAYGICPLPHSWDVTSDSIAARLAVLAGADELVLLKSGLPTDSLTLAQAAETGYVDRYFPVAAAGVPRVRCVNLRADGFPEAVLCP